MAQRNAGNAASGPRKRWRRRIHAAQSRPTERNLATERAQKARAAFQSPRRAWRVRSEGKEAYELESALESEFPRGRRRGNGVMEKRGGAGRVAQGFEKTCGVLEKRVERSGRVEFP